MNKIKGYRVMMGKTQQDLADIFGISRQSYYQKEKGNVPFTDKEKIVFRDLVQNVVPGISVGEIFFGEKVGK